MLGPTLLLLVSAIMSLIIAFCAQSAHVMGAATQDTPGKTMTVRREHKLDHLDSDTLAYYLDEYPGYDVAIMFYATWDSNSHVLAPYWAQIASVVDAGNTESRLIMGLFDCELNNAHLKLCDALSITHLPTLLFIGSGPYYDTDPITSFIFGKSRSAGIMGNAPVPNTVKFQGNWQYYDSILDWIRAMRALSKWHSKRTKLFGKPTKGQLPVGIPGARRSSSAGQTQIELLERQVEYLVNATSDMGKIAVRSGTMLDALMFGDLNATDMFTLVDERKAWKPKKPLNVVDEVYRNCLMELSLDYCQRVARRAGMQVFDDLKSSGLTDDEILKAFDTIEPEITAVMSKQEPYCGILEKCIANDMEDEACRPPACPFSNQPACRYLTSCTDSDIMLEYADALGLSLVEPFVKEVDSEPSKKKWGL